MKKRVTLEDVANRAGVSTATVSRVINSSAGVREDVIQLVTSVIDELGYRSPNRKSANRSVIGVVVPHIENPYISNAVSIIEKILDDMGYLTIVMDSYNDDLRSVDCAYYLKELGCDGIIYLPTHKKNREELRLHKIGLPIVFIGRKIDGDAVNFVGSETYNGAFNGCKYLISLGHREIIYITGDRDAEEGSVDYLGVSGYKQALLDSGLEYKKEYVFSGDYDMEKSGNIILNNFEDLKPSAIFCSGDVMAYGVINALKQLKIEIPKEVSVLGFDDLPISSVVGLTTIAQNTYSIGQNACLILDDMIRGVGREAQELEFPTNIVFRDTCAVFS